MGDPVKKIEETSAEGTAAEAATPKLSVLPAKPPPANKTSDDLQKQLALISKINDLYHENNLNLGSLISKILNLVVKALDAKGGSMWLMNDDNLSVTCKVATGPGAKEITNATVPKNKGILGWVIQNQKSTIVNDTSKDKRFNTEIQSSTNSILACPLMYRNELVGVIEIVDKNQEKELFAQKDLSLLEDICTPIGMYLKTTLMQKRQTELLKNLQTFKIIQDELSSTMDLDRLLGMVVNKVCEMLGAQVGSIWLLDETQEGVECRYAEGPTKDKVMGVKIKIGTGVVGWVVQNLKPSIVADCAKDPRFSSALDKKINFVTESMMAAPLIVKGECLGAIQVINKKNQGELFDQEDMDFLMLFAASAAMNVKNAKLFASEKKAKELSALINISKEITSTLDIDSVLLSVVNLSSDIVPYERAVISTFKSTEQKFAIRAISGEGQVDQESPEVLALTDLHNGIAQGKGEVLVNSSTETADPTQFPEAVRNYYTQRSLETFWAIVLKDDQGNIGVLSIESKEKNLVVESKKELLSLLVSQVTVALRNAELYTTIPSGKVLTTLKDQIFQAILQFKYWPLERHLKVFGGTALVLAALVFVRVPYNVETNIEVVPIVTTYYSESKARVAEVYVKEGQQVKKGDFLVRLDTTELRISRDEKESQRQKLRAEMIKLMVDEKVTDFKIKEKEKQSLDFEVEKLNQQITFSDIKAQYDGIVVSEALNELIGLPVNFGQEVIKVARTDRVFVQFEIPEEEVVHVTPQMAAKFKVFGHPNTSFTDNIFLSTVAGEGRPLNEQSPAKFFIARAEIENSGPALLRPGMTGRGKIFANREPLGYTLFNKPLRFIFTKLLF